MEFFNPDSLSKLPTQFDDIAMSRGQARQIIDRFANEAIKKNITPEAFKEGLYYIGQVAQSPDYTRRTIRNTLESPTGRLMLENPELAGQAVNQFSGVLKGVNPALAGKHMGLVSQILQEAKKDNLLRSNVTHAEIKKEIQEPMYGAFQDWIKAQNKNNPAAVNVLMRDTGFASNVGGAAKTKFDLPSLFLR